MDAVDQTRRMIQRDGESIALRRVRPGTTLTCSPIAVVQGFQPEQLVGPLVSGERVVRITDDEVSAAGMSPPQQGDIATIDGKSARVKSVDSIRYKGAVAQHVMMVTGE